jgi:hypothetical protein
MKQSWYPSPTVPRWLFVLFSVVVALFIVQAHVVAQDTASSAMTSAERQEMLTIHNEWRARVGTPPLKWSARLSAEAEKWADTLVAEDKFEHSPKPRWYSQNMAMGNSTVSATVQQWTDELPFFDRKSNSCKGDEVCGHYVQMVQRHVEEVGCAVGRSKDIWVCDYYPKLDMNYPAY